MRIGKFRAGLALLALTPLIYGLGVWLTMDKPSEARLHSAAGAFQYVYLPIFAAIVMVGLVLAALGLWCWAAITALSRRGAY